MRRAQFATVAFALGLCAVLGAKAPTDQSKTAIEYDPTTEVVLKGIVERVLRHPGDRRPEIHVILSLGDRTVEVHLAPPHYLVWHQFQLCAGDKVEIVAAKAKGEPHYLARSVKAGARTLDLRDERGTPLWQ